MKQEQSAIKGLRDFWNGLTKPEKLTWVFNVVGFVASIITLVETARIWVVVPEQASALLVTPFTGLGLWVIGCFTYIVFLHSYWQHNQRQEKYEGDFRNFLLIDLIYCFRQPVLLFPLVLLVLGLYAIMAIGNSPITAMFFSIFLIGVVSFAVYLRYSEGDNLIPDRLDISNDFKEAVEQDWADWERRIGIELERSRWLHPKDFSDLAATQGLAAREIRYVLALYASKHPETTKFGDVVKHIYPLMAPDLVVAGVLVRLDVLEPPYEVR